MDKRLFSLSITFVVLLALSVNAEPKTTLTVMHQGDPGWAMLYNKVAERFEAANPDVEIEFIYAPHDAYNEKLSAVVMSGGLPDVIELDAPYLANYVWSGYLRPIVPYLDKEVLDDMTDSNVAQGTYPIDKQLYALGLTDSTVVLYGNRKYLERIGARIPRSVDEAWTREEFENYLDRLSDLEDVKWPIDLFRGYGIKTEWVTYAFEPILASFGCDLIDRTTWKAQGALDSQPCTDALTMLQAWVRKGWVVPMSSGTNQFYAGRRAALAWGGHWVYAEAAATMKDDIVVMPLPKFGARSVSPNGTWIFGITTSSKSPALAGKFLGFLLKDREFRDFVSSQGGFPGLKTFARQSPLYAPGGPLAIAFDQASRSAQQRPPHPAYPVITSAFMQAVDRILNGSDVMEMLGAAATRIDEDIADNDGYPPFALQ
ncbi:sugar ABC transporter substrate-binding protein [Ciceribacter sp. RN22]|uniref:ABC transporter substrate-binding protein n=1 Tax=Ciceribacter sp. RN22 TaxID=2954932 RepID=UPI0020936705|nr:sugar ABC transporter substrate-binding protein [Ciceribacter sp. RN22]MCO6180995.1 sugar ABC transporter substrate-binding protein [Ciceribacter sp. RN22]